MRQQALVCPIYFTVFPVCFSCQMPCTHTRPCLLFSEVSGLWTGTVGLHGHLISSAGTLVQVQVSRDAMITAPVSGPSAVGNIRPVFTETTQYNTFWTPKHSYVLNVLIYNLLDSKRGNRILNSKGVEFSRDARDMSVSNPATTK